MAPPFVEVDVSDVDSISVTSTAPSDTESEYAVENLISEERHKDSGNMMYLVKWEGYPLHLATWEPAEHLLSGQILSDWQRDKEAVKSGVSQPFNMDLYWEALEKHQDEKEEKQRRRAAKRRKLGLPSRSGSVANGSAEDITMEDAAESSEEDDSSHSRQKQVSNPVPRRKGVAQKVKTSLNRQVTLIISSDESSDDGEYGAVPASKSSLLQKSRTKSAAKASGRSASAGADSKAAADSGARGHTTTAASATPAGKVTQKRPSVQFAASAKKTAAAPLSSVAGSADFAKRTQPSSSARKSAPSTASAPRKLPVLPYDLPKHKAPATPFIDFNKTAPERKERRLSASNPKSHRFSNLAEENRVRKFSAKEAPPDPSVLGTFNFATNKFDEPAMQPVRPRAAGLSSTSAVNNVFGRREAPARARERSVSPPSATAGNRTALSIPGDNTTMYTKVCWDWRNSKCQKEYCTFAHHFITCPDFRKGNCPLREADCKFDHKEEGRDPIFRSASETWKTGAEFHGHNVKAGPKITTQSPHQPPRPAVLALSPTDKPRIICLRPKEIPCYFWTRDGCNKSDISCKFAHYETGAPTDMRQITCGHWLTDKCQMSASKCKFAHHETAYCTLGHRSEGSVTCHFWLAGQCRNASCMFAHSDTGFISLGSQHLVPPRDAGAMSPGEIPDDEPSVLHVQTNAARGCVAPTAYTTPVSRRPSVSIPPITGPRAFTNDVIMEVKCELGDFQTGIQLACATEQDAAFLRDAIGSKKHLYMQHSIDARELQNQFSDTLKQGARFPTGDIICENSRRDRSKELAETCRQSSSCGVVQSSTYTLLVYPTGTEEWKFLTREGDKTSPQAALKFKLLPALPTTLPIAKKVTSKASAVENASGTSSATHPLNAEVERLLKINDTKTEDKVFVMMPPSRADEMQRIARIFKDRFKQADYSKRASNVWTSQEEGRWDSLAKRFGVGLLIVHTEIPLWNIPHLGVLLHRSGIRVFSVGVDPALAASQSREPAFGCQRLFPMGDVVFVTDDVFVQTPEKVLRIIDEINRQNEGKPAGASRYKIATRPGVRLWLLKLVTEMERGREDPRWMKLLEAIWDLCPRDKDDDQFPGNPSEKADLISIPPEQLPTFQALLEMNNSKATDYAVNWFAGWAFMNASKFRRFTVCHEEPGTGKWELDENYNKVLRGAEADPRGWAKEFGYLLVKTPEQWLKDKAKMKK